MSIIYRSIDVSTYVRIKPVNYPIETIEIEQPNTISIRDLNSKEARQPFTYTADGIFDSTASIVDMFEKFKETQLKRFIHNTTGSLNYFFIGQNKCHKLSDISGVCDRKTLKASRGFFQLLCEFVLENLSTFEARALKVENNKVKSLFSDIKETNYFIRINNAADIQDAVSLFRDSLNFKNNNYNLVLSLRLGKNKNKLINIVRLSMDESLQSTNRIQQIISLSDYYMLQKYIQALKNPLPNQTFIGFLDRSETLKQIEYSLLAIRGYNCVDSFSFIQYVNPNKLNYDASIDGLLFIKGLQADISNRRADLGILKASNLDAMKKTDRESMDLQYELNEQTAVYNKVQKQVTKYLDTFERLSGLKITIEDILEDHNKILSSIEERHHADVLYKDAEQDADRIINEANEEEAELRELDIKYEEEISELNKRSKKLNKEIQDLKSKYINLAAENRRNKEQFDQNCVNHMQEEGKRVVEEISPIAEVFNKNMAFELERENAIQFKKEKEKAIQSLKEKHKKQLNGVLEAYNNDCSRYDQKFVDKSEGLKFALDKVHKQFADYNRDKEREIERLDAELSVVENCHRSLVNRKGVSKAGRDLDVVKQKLKGGLDIKKDVANLSDGDLKSLKSYLDELNSSKSDGKEIECDQNKENEQKINNLRNELQTIRKKNLEMETLIYKKTTISSLHVPYSN